MENVTRYECRKLGFGLSRPRRSLNKEDQSKERSRSPIGSQERSNATDWADGNDRSQARSVQSPGPGTACNLDSWTSLKVEGSEWSQPMVLTATTWLAKSPPLVEEWVVQLHV